MKKKNQALAILFWLNRQRSKNQMPAIYLRFTLEYKRIELTTHLYVDAQLWNPESQCLSGTSEEVKEINNKLSVIKANLHKQYSLLLALGKPITLDTLKKAYLGIGERQRTLSELLDFYYSRFAEKVATGSKAKNTLKCVYTTREKIKAFLKPKLTLISAVGFNCFDYSVYGQPCTICWRRYNISRFCGRCYPGWTRWLRPGTGKLGSAVTIS